MLEEELGRRDQRLEKFLLAPIEEGLEQLQVRRIDGRMCFKKLQLQRVIDEAPPRQLQLQEHFIEAKSTREETLKELKSRRGSAKPGLSQMRKTLDHLEASTADKLRVKTKLRKRLAALGDEDATAIGRNERAKYVRGIMEIMANVSKQNEEILKVTKWIS